MPQVSYHLDGDGLGDGPLLPVAADGISVGLSVYGSEKQVPRAEDSADQ